MRKDVNDTIFYSQLILIEKSLVYSTHKNDKPLFSFQYLATNRFHYNSIDSA